MSLILEALRKSEAERRRAQAPDLHAEPGLALPRPQHEWPRWTKPALAGVGLVALLVLLRAVWPPATPVTSPPVAQPTPVAKQVPAATAPVEAAPTPATPAVAATPRPAPQSGVPAPPPAQPAPVRAAATAGVATTPALEPPRMMPDPIAETPAPVAAATMPTPIGDPADDSIRLSDLGTEERQQLPALKLSMHMWNDSPAQRFVILDGQRLGEGDRIGDTVVEQITRDGAILGWHGRRLRVSMR